MELKLPDFSSDEKALLLGIILQYQNLKDERDTALAQELSLTPEELATQLAALREKVVNG